MTQGKQSFPESNAADTAEQSVFSHSSGAPDWVELLLSEIGSEAAVARLLLIDSLVNEAAGASSSGALRLVEVIGLLADRGLEHMGGLACRGNADEWLLSPMLNKALQRGNGGAA